MIDKKKDPNRHGLGDDPIINRNLPTINRNDYYDVEELSKYLHLPIKSVWKIFENKWRSIYGYGWLLSKKDFNKWLLELKNPVRKYEVNLKNALLGKCECIYFLQDNLSKFIKIGRTVNYPQRIRQHQKEYESRLIQIGIIAGEYEIEREIHKRFKHYKMHNEWFLPKQEIFDYLKESGHILNKMQCIYEKKSKAKNGQKSFDEMGKVLNIKDYKKNPRKKNNIEIYNNIINLWNEMFSRSKRNSKIEFTFNLKDLEKN